MILWLAGCIVGAPVESTVDAVWPFPGATAIGPSAGIVLEHDADLDEVPYGVSRVYGLTGPDGAVPFTPQICPQETNWLVLQPDAPLSDGDCTLTISLGTDSRNIALAYRRPAGLPDSLEFSTSSAPVPLCVGWYDPENNRLTWHASRHLLPCVHWTEPLVPGWVDLASDQFEVDGAPLKTSGLVPESFPELLCAVPPDGTEIQSWSLRIEPENVSAAAGGVLTDAVTVSSEDASACTSLDFVIPRWRPEEILSEE